MHKRRTYSFNAAAIFVERGEHIVVRNCDIHGSASGIFVASGDSEAQLSRDITIENCLIHGNGTVSRFLDHNIYTEAIGTLIQYNRLSPLRAGATGNNVKDRSAGTVIRYNWIEGGAHLLDLVEAQESYKFTMADPRYHKTFVYGNVLVNGPYGAASIIHYGGDQGYTPTYRKGHLYFYNNTVVNIADRKGQTNRWRTILLNLDTNDEIADLHNNIIYSAAATPNERPAEFSLLAACGNVNCGYNWISPGWRISRTAAVFTGNAFGTSNIRTGQPNDPGFMNVSTLDVHLAANSPCINTGGPLVAEDQRSFPVDDQFELTPQGVNSSRGRAGSDLGAFEYNRSPSGRPGGDRGKLDPHRSSGSAATGHDVGPGNVVDLSHGSARHDSAIGEGSLPKNRKHSEDKSSFALPGDDSVWAVAIGVLGSIIIVTVVVVVKRLSPGDNSGKHS